MSETSAFSTAQAAAITGVSLRQLQVWDECGFVRAGRDGHFRQYGRREVLTLAVVARLREKGVSLAAIKRVQPGLGKIVDSVLTHGRPGYLVTDGSNHWRAIDRDAIVSTVCSSPGFLVVLPLTDIAANLLRDKALATVTQAELRAGC